MSAEDKGEGALSVFLKQPLGGVDRRSLLTVLKEHGARVAKEDLAREQAALVPQGVRIAKDAAVLLLGGSNGILRSVAVQLALGEGVPVVCVHYDSEKLQIGPFHLRALRDAAEARGVAVHSFNEDATKPEVQAECVAYLRERFRCVHLLNGIANGATKRWAEKGKALVKDLDVAFDPVRQIPDFSSWEKVRKAGLVEVDVASELDVERTHKMMGRSTSPWADALAAAGLLVPGESVVGFADYDFEPEDPVYASGPLASAKVLAREDLARVGAAHKVRTARLCYPAMNTTALGTIPGGCLMFAGTAQLLLERDRYRNLAALARETMALWAPDASEEALRLDAAFAATRPEFHARMEGLRTEVLPSLLSRVVGYAGL